MTTNRIILALSLVLTISCKGNYQEDEVYQVENEIKFNLEDIQGEEYFSECFSVEKIIPLESSSNLIGSVDKILFDKEHIYIQDIRTNSLHKYSITGNFITKIGSVGQGPTEYTKLSDFILFKDKIIILDSHLGKLLFYDLSGSFLKRKSIEGIFKKMTTNGDVIFISNGNMTSFFSPDKSIAVVNEEVKVLNNLLKIPNSLKNKSISSYKPFSNQQKRILYCSPLSNDIFGLEKDSVWVSYRLDFGEHTLNELSLKENKNIGELFLKANKEGKVFAVDYLNETNQFLSFVSLYKGQALMIFYDKENNASQIFSLDKFSSSFRSVCAPILNTYNNTFVTAVVPALLEKDSIPHFIPENLKDEENPILIFYRLKF